MKKLGITQRVDEIHIYGERRDCLDQRFYQISYALGFIPVPLPNLAKRNVPELIAGLGISAVLLSSGNSIANLDDYAEDFAPERDAFELAIIEYSLKHKIPIFGICRGMHIINHFFNGTLVPGHDHVANRHLIEFEKPERFASSREVNSYHNWAITRDTIGLDLVPMATHIDRTVEMFFHTSAKIGGIMWHPERELDLHPHDLDILKRGLL